MKSSSSYLQRLVNKITIISLIGSFFVQVPVIAGGTSFTLTPSSSSAAATPVNVTITWTGSAVYTTSSNVVLVSDSALTSIDECATPTFDLDADGDYDGDVSATTTSQLTYAMTSSTTVTTNSLCVELTFSATAKNYGLSFYVETGASILIDYGASLFYANGGNQVTVTGQVLPSLSFSIVTAADGATTNTCDLGVLSIVATSTCNYRLRIATNTANGFQAQLKADHDFGTGSATMTNATNDGAQPTAGTERYGLSFIYGATEGGRNTTTLAFTEPVVEDNPVGFTFGTDPSPVPTSTALNFISYNAQFQTGPAPSTTTTTMVEHAASITAGTAAGSYQQTLTYTVTGSF